MVQEINDKGAYDAKKASGKLVVDYHATWCGPCKVIAPKIEALAQEYSDIAFIKVDVDKGSDIAQEEKISAMPTFRFFNNGQKVGEVVGANEAAIRQEVEKLKAL